MALAQQQLIGAGVLKNFRRDEIGSSKRAALKSLVQEIYEQGVTIRDIARTAGTYHRSIHRWVYTDAFPNTCKDFEKISNDLLKLLDTYKENENRILEKMMICRKATSIRQLSFLLKMNYGKVRVYLGNLTKRGLVRGDCFNHFKLTPKGVAETKWVKAKVNL